MAQKYDPARLAQLRDKHAELRARYASSTEKVQRAADDLAAARREAPPKIVNVKAPKHAFAVGIRHTELVTRFAEFEVAYFAPIDVLEALSDEDIHELQLSGSAVKRILIAGKRLDRLRREHSALAITVTASSAFMVQMENFAKANRL